MWHEAHFQVKMNKTHQLQTTFGSWDVEQVHAVVARSTIRSQKCKKLRGTEHFGRSDVVLRGRHKGVCTLPKVRKTWRFCSSLNYTHHYTPLHSITTTTTLHYTTLDSNRLHFTSLPSLHYNQLHYTTLQLQLQLQLQLHYITLHYTTLRGTAPRSTPLIFTSLPSLHYTTLHSITLLYTTLRYATLNNATLHDTTLHFSPHFSPHSSLHFSLHYTTLH